MQTAPYPLARRWLMVLLGAAGAGSVCAQVSVTTERYDNARSGANLAETRLTTANVNSAQFGKLWTYAVDGSVFAQPLYVPNLAIPGAGTHDVLYVVTMNDVVYAFDADSSALLWSRDLRNPPAGVTPVPIVDLVTETNAPANDLNIVGTVGIESTPQIDPNNGTMYLVARTKENGAYVQRLHALDITTGAERSGSPATIQGSVAGGAAGGSTVGFDPMIQNQRAGLALANGQIYIAWGSHEDQLTYHGWVMSYDETTLVQTGIFCDSCFESTGNEGGIWMGSRAPAVDASGNVYYMTGNGSWDGANDFGESFVKLGAPNAGLLSVFDWFTPDDWNALNSGDVDLGSCGPLLIPGTNLIVGGGKESLLYLTSTAGLGHEVTGNTQIAQTVVVNPSAINSEYHIIGGGPVYWDRSGGTGAGSWLYVWANTDVAKAYRFNGTTFDGAMPPSQATTPVSQGIVSAPPSGAGPMTLSANGSTPGSGILWTTLPSDDADHGVHPGTLYAFDAGNLANQLWNSTIHPADDMGLWPKYSPPIVVNGRVYVASFSGFVSVYGLLPTAPDFLLTTAPATAVAYPGGSPNYTVGTTAVAGYSGNVNLAIGPLPPGVTASWSNADVAAGGSATLTLTTSSVTPPGSYELAISGSGSSGTHTATIALVVQPARVISINFWGGCNGMGNTEAAGVVPKPYWNSALNTTNYYGQRALNDETGMPSGAWATWNAGGNSADSANPAIPDSAGNDRMMRCYLDPIGASATVNISSLPTSPGGYAIYVYADGVNGSATRTGSYQISGPGITTNSIDVTDAANTDFSGTFTQADAADNWTGNYAIFPIGPTASGFTLTATPGAASDGTMRVPLNGIQIVPQSGVPDVPTGVSATAGDARASVSFLAAAGDGGSPITGYTATSNPGGLSASGSSSPLTVTGLTNGSAYTFTVVATNAIGSSAPSAASNSVTPATVPDTPTGVVATAGNTKATVSFVASFDEGRPITGYTVASSPTGGVDSNAGTTVLNHVVTGLTNGTAYTFTVVATNAIGSSAPSAASNSVTPATVPDAPTGVVATAGNTKATVSFLTPFDEGRPITGYTVTSSPAGGVDSNAGTTVLNHVVTGLTNGTAYTFTAVATNPIGSSAPSKASNSVTPATVPDAPTGVVATAGNTKATVSFVAPFDEGRPITGYTVASSSTGGVDSNAGTTGLSHVVTGLTNGTAYTFTVVATNAIGSSKPSAASNAVVPGVAPAFTSAGAATFTVLAGNTFKIVANGSPVPTLSIASGTLPAGVTFSPASGVLAGTPSSGSVGSYPLTFKASNGIAPDATQGFTLTVAQASQTIAFSIAANESYGSGPIPLTASASSGLPVSITTTTPAVCAVIGNNLDLLAAGPCTLVARQTGNADYAAAIPVTQNVIISPAPPSAPSITGTVLENLQVTITFTPPANTGGTPVTGYNATCVASIGRTGANGSASPVTVTGLVWLKTYACTVSASNAAGAGPASAPVTVLPGDLIFANGFE